MRIPLFFFDQAAFPQELTNSYTGLEPSSKGIVSKHREHPYRSRPEQGVD
jgi:hypothetical protein